MPERCALGCPFSPGSVDHEISPEVSKKDSLLYFNKKVIKLEAREPAAVGVGSPSAAKFDVARIDGTSSLTAFKYQFETLVKTNHWDGVFCGVNFGSTTGPLEYLPSDGRSLECLMEVLNTRYGDKHFEHVFRALLRERTQRSNKSLQQWGVEVERYADDTGDGGSLPDHDTSTQDNLTTCFGSSI